MYIKRNKKSGELHVSKIKFYAGQSYPTIWGNFDQELKPYIILTYAAIWLL